LAGQQELAPERVTLTPSTRTLGPAGQLRDASPMRKASQVKKTAPSG